jgi:hypothetical protein
MLRHRNVVRVRDLFSVGESLGLAHPTPHAVRPGTGRGTPTARRRPPVATPGAAARRRTPERAPTTPPPCQTTSRQVMGGPVTLKSCRGGSMVVGIAGSSPVEEATRATG